LAINAETFISACLLLGLRSSDTAEHQSYPAHLPGKDASFVSRDPAEGIGSIPTCSNSNVGISVRINVVASLDIRKLGTWRIIEVRELTTPNARAKPKQTTAANRSVDAKRQAAAGRYVCREVLNSSIADRVIHSIVVASTTTATRAGHEIDVAAAIKLVVL